MILSCSLYICNINITKKASPAIPLSYAPPVQPFHHFDLAFDHHHATNGILYVVCIKNHLLNLYVSKYRNQLKPQIELVETDENIIRFKGYALRSTQTDQLPILKDQEGARIGSVQQVQRLLLLLYVYTSRSSLILINSIKSSSHIVIFCSMN